MDEGTNDFILVCIYLFSIFLKGNKVKKSYGKEKNLTKQNTKEKKIRRRLIKQCDRVEETYHKR